MPRLNASFIEAANDQTVERYQAVLGITVPVTGL
jgi:hypothetical protein